MEYAKYIDESKMKDINWDYPLINADTMLKI